MSATPSFELVRETELRRASVLIAFAALASITGPAAAQETQTPIRVYFDCRGGCDFDYIRTEVSFVDYVRDREVADVHILVTTQFTGTGGREFTINFIGLQSFAAISDTLRYVSSNDDTDEIRRRGLARVLAVGLMRFVGQTPLATRMQLSVAPDPAPAAGTGTGAQVRDPWNFWVFRIGLDGSIDGESREDSREVGLDLSANRTTEEWKIELEIEGDYSDDSFEIDSVTTVTSVRRSYEIDALVVNSLGPHFSAGFEASIESSTFGNQKLAWRLAPAIEYNVFPYAESTRRVFVFRYGAGINAYRWREITIFGETEEARPQHALSAGYSTREPWGSTGLALEFSQFLHDTQKYRLDASGNAEIRVLRGLSFDVGASYARIRDQLSIPARDATPEEILLRQRQLLTSYEFRLNVGVSYRFGSIFNNVVNPRFRRGFGRFRRF